MTTSCSGKLSDCGVVDKDTTAQTMDVDSEALNALRECKEQMNTRSKTYIFLATIAAIVAIGSFGNLPSSASETIAPLTEVGLLNGLCNVPTVSEAGSETVQFKGGKAEWNGCRGEIVKTAIGDLNGDGIKDGAFVFTYNSGGSGYFTSLLVFVASEKGAKPVGERSLGDRSIANSLKICHGTITLDVLGHRGSDSASSPTLRRVVKFKVKNTALVGPENLQ
jgi:hypothetical protein